MFSGITKAKLTVNEVTPYDGGVTLVFAFPQHLLDGLQKGTSVAVSGVCLTVTTISGNNVSFDAMQETLDKTTLSAVSVGSEYNIERSIRVGDEIGGHVVSGHVSGMVEIVSIEDNRYTFQTTPNMSKYIFSKGFVALDGCSLTVVGVDREANTFTVSFIPETLSTTTFGNRQIGDTVNLELEAQTVAVVDTVERVLASS